MTLRSKITLVSTLLLAGFTLAAPVSASPTAQDVIARARSVLGAEADLAGVNTLQYYGDIYDGKGQKGGSVVLEFKKPANQRSEYTTPTYVQITATDGLEAWSLRTDAKGKKSLVILMPPNLEAFINTSYENLFFYEGPNQVREGSVVLVGPAAFHGVNCWQVTFNYPGSITLTRYFDQATGELRGTVTDNGRTEIIESGKLVVNGITFPNRVTSYSDGVLAHVVVFDKIVVNPPIDDQVFEVPNATELLSPANPAPAPSADILSPDNATINVPPATPQPNEQPLNFQIKTN
jgi:hypothetical protein